MDDDEYGGIGRQDDGREVAHRIVRYAAFHERKQPKAAAEREQRVAVGRRFANNIAGEYGAASILDDHLLPERGRDSLRDQARRKIVSASRFGRHDPYRFDRITLRAGCRGRQRHHAATQNFG